MANVADDMVAWLSKILDEVEALASNDLTPGRWEVRFQCPDGDHDHDWDEVWIASETGSTVAGLNERYTCAPRDAAHIVRHDPTAVLARVAADRLILEDYHEAREAYSIHPTLFGEGRRWAAVMAVARVAEAYADRPGWREEWRP